MSALNDLLYFLMIISNKIDCPGLSVIQFKSMKLILEKNIILEKICLYKIIKFLILLIVYWNECESHSVKKHLCLGIRWIWHAKMSARNRPNTDSVWVQSLHLMTVSQCLVSLSQYFSLSKQCKRTFDIKIQTLGYWTNWTFNVNCLGTLSIINSWWMALYKLSWQLWYQSYKNRQTSKQIWEHFFFI
jgi:hypothetical protein